MSFLFRLSVNAFLHFNVYHKKMLTSEECRIRSLKMEDDQRRSYHNNHNNERENTNNAF